MGESLGCCMNTLQREHSHSLLPNAEPYEEDNVIHNPVEKVVETPSSAASVSKTTSARSYRQALELVFWTFAGSSSGGRKNLYMSMAELNCFLDIVGLNDNNADIKITADKILDILGKDDATRITCGDFVDYFCDKDINYDCEKIEKYLYEESKKWNALQNALKIFDIVDKDKSGCIDFSEFITFCQLIGENDTKNMENLWHSIDEDDNGQVVIHELFDWYQKRLSSQ